MPVRASAARRAARPWCSFPMSLSTVLQGDIRKTKLDSLIKCSLDDSHKELQTVLQQGVDGRDESRCAGVAQQL